MRDARSALIKVCEHRMRTSDAGNIDTFIILLNQMKRANNVLKLPVPKRRFGKMLNDCLDSMMQSTESLRGKSGAARVIFGHFSGRAASVLHRRLTKEFHDVANAAGGVPRATGYAGTEAAAKRSSFYRGVTATATVGRFNRETDKCFRCGTVGHMGRECVIDPPPTAHTAVKRERRD